MEMTPEHRIHRVEYLMKRHSELFGTYFCDLDEEQSQIVLERIILFEEELHNLLNGKCK